MAAIATSLLLTSPNIQGNELVRSVKPVKAERVVINPVNINLANAQQLTVLKGVGDKKAQAIISYREQHGNFNSIDELLNVKGVGEKILLDNKELLSL